MIEFHDGIKPVMIQLTNMNVPVETLYRTIAERVNKRL